MTGEGTSTRRERLETGSIPKGNLGRQVSFGNDQWGNWLNYCSLNQTGTVVSWLVLVNPAELVGMVNSMAIVNASPNIAAEWLVVVADRTVHTMTSGLFAQVGWPKMVKNIDAEWGLVLRNQG